MRILGVSLRNAYAALAVIECENDSWDLADTTGTRKIDLGNHEDSSALRSFALAIDTFINSHAIDRVVIRRCTYSGQKRSGAGAIKMEALLQLMDREVVLLAPQTIAARFKKSGAEYPDGITHYQREAFETALSTMSSE